MIRRLPGIVALVFCGAFLSAFVGKATPTRRSHPARPLAWAYARGRGVALLRKPGRGKSSVGKLARGQVAEVLENKIRGGVQWTRLLAFDPANLEPQVGWVESRLIYQLAWNDLPTDHALLTAIGGEYLDDAVRSRAVIVRYFARRKAGDSRLVAWVGSPFLSQMRLQLFHNRNGQWRPGPFLSFPYAGMETPIERMEIRNLRGGAGECLISTEHAPSGLGAELRQIVIRRLGRKGLRTVWRAPVEWTNLSSYPPQINVLAPAVRNLGAPGTKTQGKVTFAFHNGIGVPVWDGTVSFYVIGRHAPVRTLTFKKTCYWNGARFASLTE